MLGGNIRVDSIPDIGSTFTFDLPFMPGILQSPEKRAENKEPFFVNVWSDKTILLAEDEEVNSFYIETVLKSTGVNHHYSAKWIGGCRAVQKK